MSSTHVTLLTTSPLSISSRAYLFLHLFPLSIFSWLILISHLRFMFLIISSSLFVRFPLCSFFFSFTKTTGSPSCSFMFKNYNVSTRYSQHLHIKWHHCRLALLILQKYLHLTLNLPTTTIVAQPFNVIKWQLKFNPVA